MQKKRKKEKNQEGGKQFFISLYLELNALSSTDYDDCTLTTKSHGPHTGLILFKQRNYPSQKTFFFYFSHLYNVMFSKQVTLLCNTSMSCTWLWNSNWCDKISFKYYVRLNDTYISLVFNQIIIIFFSCNIQWMLVNVSLCAVRPTWVVHNYNTANDMVILQAVKSIGCIFSFLCNFSCSTLQTLWSFYFSLT